MPGLSGGFTLGSSVPTMMPQAPASDTNNPHIQTVNKNWTKRLPNLQKLGFDLHQHILPAVSYDKQRVRQGTSPLGNAEAMDLLTAIKTGREPLHKQDAGHSDILGIPGTHILGNAVGDIQQITGGLLALPGQLAHDVPAFVHDVAHGMPEWTNPTTSSGLPDWSKGLGEIAKTPLVRFLPGISTLQHLAAGDEPKFLSQHPVMGGLDILPYASFGGEVGAIGRLKALGISAEEAGPITRALAEGRPLRAASNVPVLPRRLTGEAMAREGSRGTTLHDVSRVVQKKIGVPIEVREAGRRLMQTLRDPRDPVMRKMFDERDALAKERDSVMKDIVKKTGPKHFSESQRVMLDDYNLRIEAMTKALRSYGVSEWGRWIAHTLGQTKAQALAEIMHDIERGVYERELQRTPKYSGKQYEKIASGKGKVGVPNEVRAIYEKTKRPLLGTPYRPGVLDLFNISKKDRNALKYILKQELGTDQIVVPAWFMAPFRLQEWGRHIEETPVGKIVDTATDVFKYSVLTGPRHLVHIISSNVVFNALEHPTMYASPTTWVRSIDMLRNPLKWVQEMPHGMQLYRTDLIGSIAEGKTMGRLMYSLRKYGGSIPRFFKHMEDFTVNFNRAMLFTFEHDKAIKHGELESAAHQAGLQAVDKVLMDMDGMAPIERVILRRVIPFYPFLRQLLRYMARYPADHPVRAAVLSRIGQLEFQDLGNDLPWKMDSLFFLGSPDTQGNVQAIDMKNWNPFRSMEGNNPFTLAGFLSAFHPGIQSLMEMAGGHPLSATPELFPELTVDQYSGGLVARHPDIAATTIETFIPPAAALDQIFNLSGQFKSLQQASGHDSTDVWRRTLMSHLNMPFIPFNVNVKEEEAKFAAHWFSTAKQDVKNALSSGDTSQLGQYRRLPVQTGSGFHSKSGFMKPEDFNRLFSQLQKEGAT